jgi:hypothetical protein
VTDVVEGASTAQPVSSRSDGLGNEALVAATGRTWAEWFEVLDAAGAGDWKHPQIASWLRDAHDVPPWWCQTVTVGFEQERGMRMPGQRADGTFEVSASRTIPGEPADVLDSVITIVSASLAAQPTSHSREATYPTARWGLDGREMLVARANPSKNGKTSVSLTHQRMADPAQVKPAKTVLQAWLVAVSS